MSWLPPSWSRLWSRVVAAVVAPPKCVPSWARFPSYVAFAQFTGVVRAALMKQGVVFFRGTLESGSIVLDGPGGAPIEWILWELASRCVVAPEVEWPAMVERELRPLLGGVRPVMDPSLGFDAAPARETRTRAALVPLSRVNNRGYYLLRQDEPQPVLEEFEGRAFPCLLWDAGGARTAEERHLVVASLIARGCRYFVCGGNDCSAWEEAADDAFVTTTLSLSQAERDARHVMTTHHAGESEEDVAFFFVFNTGFGAHVFEDYLVLAIGERGVEEHLCRAVRDQALRTARDHLDA